MNTISAITTKKINIINTLKLTRGLVIILVVIILLQMPISYDKNIKNRRYYTGESIIGDIDMGQTIPYTDTEIWKKNFRLNINHIYLLYYLEFILIFNLNHFLPLKKIVVDIKKAISGFTLVYFSVSKYRSTCTYFYSL